MVDTTFVPKVYKNTGGDKMVVASGGEILVETGGNVQADNIVKNIRTQFTVAQVNAGATLLSAVSGFKYRMVDCAIQVIGGAAGAGTTVDILGTQTSAVKLVAFAQAQLTDDAYLRPGVSGAAVLANGVSFLANDANTAITIGKTGSSFTTATHFDVIFSYVIEAA